jgi:aryl-alcohol dehydrogenase-like predicted oxidoreductase
MQYRLLGHSGLRVSEFALGTMTFGEDYGWGTAKDESRRIFDAFREAGGNFLDTANIYTGGTSETFLGEFIAGQRQNVVLATKYSNSNPATDPNAAGNHRKCMVQTLEASLRRLRTDYIDLFWMHVWDQLTPVEEVMRGLDDLIRQGKVLYVGASNAPAWWIAQANTIAALRGWSPFVGLQIEYSLIERSAERELLPMCRALGLGVTAWSPLAGGVLSGKYQTAEGSQSRFTNAIMRQFMPEPQTAEPVVAALRTVAGQTGRSLAQVALAWLRYRPQPIIPIVGARKLSQLQDNLASLELSLSPEQVRLLDDARRIEMGVPYDFYARPRVQELAYAGMRDRIIA